MASLDVTGHRIRFGHVQVPMDLDPHGGYLGVGSGREPGEIRQITAVLGPRLEDRGNQNDCRQEVNLDF